MFQMDGGEDVPSEEEDEENGLDERQDQDSDDGGGWITPGNIKQIQQEMKQCAVPKDVRVGCVTTDFAMQVGGVGNCRPGLSVIPVRTVVPRRLGMGCAELLHNASFPGSRNFAYLYGNLPFCLAVGDS